MPSSVASTAPGIWPVRGRDALGAPGRLWASATVSAVALLGAVSFGVGNHVYRRHQAPLWLPAVPPVAVLAVFYDVAPIEITVTRNWLKFSFVVPRYQFLADPTLWRQMNFDDWDRLDTVSRHEGLTRLLAAHGHLIAAPALWRRMTAGDWDDVPQPVRAMAVVGMIEYWVRFYEGGAAYELDSTLVMRTVKAVAMSESWFDHRAFYVNADGSADIGIGGASAFARDALRRLHDRGGADFTLADDEYDNPWLATRWLAFWLRLSLDEARGDLGLATRAHNVGIGRALRGQGEDYQAGVERRRRRYFEGPSDSRTWSALSQYRRDQLWLPRLIVRPLLRANMPFTPCVDQTCALPAAPLREPPTTEDDGTNSTLVKTEVPSRALRALHRPQQRTDPCRVALSWRCMRRPFTGTMHEAMSPIGLVQLRGHFATGGWTGTVGNGAPCAVQCSRRRRNLLTRVHMPMRTSRSYPSNCRIRTFCVVRLPARLG